MKPYSMHVCTLTNIVSGWFLQQKSSTTLLSQCKWPQLKLLPLVWFTALQSVASFTVATTVFRVSSRNLILEGKLMGYDTLYYIIYNTILWGTWICLGGKLSCLGEGRSFPGAAPPQLDEPWCWKMLQLLVRVG